METYNCPRCGSPVEKWKDAFIEVGDYNERTGSCESEGDVNGYHCTNPACLCEFWVFTASAEHGSGVA